MTVKLQNRFDVVLMEHVKMKRYRFYSKLFLYSVF